MTERFFSPCLLCLFIVMTLFSCASDNNIMGAWTGYSIEQQDSIYVDAKPERCSLYLGENSYFFKGNTNHIEMGLYELNEDLLTFTDTLRNSESKNISFNLISNDSLILIMNNHGKRLELSMKR